VESFTRCRLTPQATAKTAPPQRKIICHVCGHKLGGWNRTPYKLRGKPVHDRCWAAAQEPPTASMYDPTPTTRPWHRHTPRQPDQMDWLILSQLAHIEPATTRELANQIEKPASYMNHRLGNLRIQGNISRLPGHPARWEIREEKQNERGANEAP